MTDNKSELQEACRLGDVELVKKLLGENVDPTWENTYGVEYL